MRRLPGGTEFIGPKNPLNILLWHLQNGTELLDAHAAGVHFPDNFSAAFRTAFLATFLTTDSSVGVFDSFQAFFVEHILLVFGMFIF